VALIVTFIINLFIFYIYRKTFKGVIYTREFNGVWFSRAWL